MSNVLYDDNYDCSGGIWGNSTNTVPFTNSKGRKMKDRRYRDNNSSITLVCADLGKENNRVPRCKECRSKHQSAEFHNLSADEKKKRVAAMKYAQKNESQGEVLFVHTCKNCNSEFRCTNDQHNLILNGGGLEYCEDCLNKSKQIFSTKNAVEKFGITNIVKDAVYASSEYTMPCSECGEPMTLKYHRVRQLFIKDEKPVCRNCRHPKTINMSTPTINDTSVVDITKQHENVDIEHDVEVVSKPDNISNVVPIDIFSEDAPDANLSYIDRLREIVIKIGNVINWWEASPIGVQKAYAMAVTKREIGYFLQMSDSDKYQVMEDAYKMFK